MNKTLKAALSFRWLGLVIVTGLSLGLGGCASFFHQPPAAARLTNPQTSFPALQTKEVYFFLSREAFPMDLRFIQVADLLTPFDTQWSYRELVSNFQKKAAEVGANAVIFTHVGTSKMDMGYLSYSGQAVAYRLYKQNPSEDVDLSSSPYGTQNPDLGRVK